MPSSDTMSSISLGNGRPKKDELAMMKHCYANAKQPKTALQPPLESCLCGNFTLRQGVLVFSMMDMMCSFFYGIGPFFPRGADYWYFYALWMGHAVICLSNSFGIVGAIKKDQGLVKLYMWIQVVTWPLICLFLIFYMAHLGEDITATVTLQLNSNSQTPLLGASIHSAHSPGESLSKSLPSIVWWMLPLLDFFWALGLVWWKWVVASNYIKTLDKPLITKEDVNLEVCSHLDIAEECKAPFESDRVSFDKGRGLSDRNLPIVVQVNDSNETDPNRRSLVLGDARAA